MATRRKFPVPERVRLTLTITSMEEKEITELAFKVAFAAHSPTGGNKKW